MLIKLFPKEKGIYSQGVQIEDGLQRAGVNEDGTWTSTDYPLKQNICIGFSTQNKEPFNVEIVKTKKATTFPVKGSFADIVNRFTPQKVEENINKKEPYILSHLYDNTLRIEKSIFFLGEKEKFLIPTSNIFSAYFPGKDIPSPSSENDLIYSEYVVGFPEGVLVSYKEGVFVISNNKMSLIRSPELFESLGYDWGNILTANPYESNTQARDTGLLSFSSANPNGTVLKNNDKYFLIWNSSLYAITKEEKEEYFKYNPLIEVEEKKDNVNCIVSNGKAKCCIDNYDPRINPPSYTRFNNTILWKIDDINSFDWEDSVKINKENFLHKLRGLRYKFTYIFS